MTKKERVKEDQEKYYNQLPEDVFLSKEEFYQKFKDFDTNKYQISRVFMWNNTIITIKGEL